MNARPFDEADFRAVAALLAEDGRWHGRPSQIGPNEVREWTSLTDLANDSWLYEDGEGSVAVGWATVHDELGAGVGVVHPRAKGRGLGTELLERSETRLRERGVTRLQQFALASDTRAAELLRRRGYDDVRHFFEMAIHLEERPGASGVAVETFREAAARGFYDALDEAFQDHWEHHSRGFDEWWVRHNANPNFDPTLWFLIRDGEEIVATCRNEANRNGGGYVAAIGVRRPWRGKGYAKALLLHTFREFYDRGVRRVTLGVDAANATGATHLYERVGMHVEAEDVVFEKALA
ncbi:MAG TPA: GNAT family N-acetyltransferase [Gaiellaceae bacterium]|nr:GNAT family N-acetyltransferase [Gaiellaceae bacterium]